VLGPVRDRVAQLLAGHALEGGYLPGLVQPTQQVVERAVLEHDHNHMIKRVVPALTLHLGPLRLRSPLLTRPALVPVAAAPPHPSHCRLVQDAGGTRKVSLPSQPTTVAAAAHHPVWMTLHWMTHGTITGHHPEATGHVRLAFAR
jgi:hypothetical protein